MHVAAGTGRVVAGRYLLQHPLGRGAMGTVWRAWDSVLAREVAVKEVRLRGATTEDTRVLYERSLREARIAARLNHPAVVTVFDVIDAGGSPWIVMELIEARSLEQVLAEDGPLLPHQAADLGTRLLGALDCAHAAGILHRDVKPSNVLLGAGGRTVLTDFGIATLDGDSTLTQAGMVMGTPGFTAPERVRGEPASPASDLWSLGATLYAAVEGHGPFDDRGSPLAILAAIANEEAPRPRSAGLLRPVIEALLRRDPGARPPAAAAASLLAAAAGESGADHGADAAGPPPWAPGWPDDAARLPLSAGHPADPVDLHLVVPADRAGPDWPSIAQPSEPEPFQAEPFAAQPFAAQPFAAQPYDAEPFEPEPVAAGSFAAGSFAAEPIDAEPIHAVAFDAAPSAEPRGGVSAPQPRRARPVGLGALLPDRRGALIAFLAGLIVLGAGILGGLAWTHLGGGAPAERFHSYTVSGSMAGSAAGFTTALPDGWRMAQRGSTTVFTSPSGRTTLRVTPTSLGTPRAIGAARLLEARALQQRTFPGYRRIALRPFRFAGGSGALWQYMWQPGRGGRAEALEALFRLATPAGRQAYLVQETAPARDWVASRLVFTKALDTFRVHS
jgi:eukaryotic-like serine/threonine-protein kinase